MKKKLSILLIEDDPIEVMKFNRVVSNLSDISSDVKVAKDGEDALKQLSIKEQTLPDIILLDLNMPKISGLEFLKILKNNDTLKYIPTIILTTSSNRKDMLNCYKEGVSGYMLKPLRYEDYVSKITKTLNYWFENELISA